ncbi:MAG: ABC transporter substrate-binding protein, partial [Rhodospirillales bacterium]|nr:ABC transporter substrate-binding protein [Rhodospirillales bacterium]
MIKVQGTRRAFAAVVTSVLLSGLLRPAMAADETIRLGAILPLTGPGAVVGTQEMRGIQFAMDAANAKGGVQGHKIEVIFEDNQAKPDVSVLSFNKLVDLQKVPMIFTGYSGPSLAMAPLATRKKILMINAGAQSDKLTKASPYLVNTLPSTGDEVAVMAKYLVQQGKKKAAVLFENDAAGIGGRDDFLELFPKAGGTILAQEAVQFGQTDYRPALLKLAAAKPDVLYVVITAGMVPLVQQLHDLHGRSRRDRRSRVQRDHPHAGADRRAARTLRRVQGEVRRRHGFLRAPVLQRRADHADGDRQGAVGEEAGHRRKPARHAVRDPQVPGPDPDGVQEQHGHRAHRHQQDGERQGRYAAAGDGGVARPLTDPRR